MPKRGRVAEKSYMAVEVYYKHGEYNIEYFYSVGALRCYLADKLLSDRERRREYGYERKDNSNGDEEEKFGDEGMSLDELIAAVIKSGREMISEQCGYGVVCVQEIVSA